MQGLCTWEIDFVQNRDDGQLIVDSKVDVCQCLGFDPLRGIDHQKTAFTRCKASADLVAKIYMPASSPITQRTYSSPKSMKGFILHLHLACHLSCLLRWIMIKASSLQTRQSFFILVVA